MSAVTHDLSETIATRWQGEPQDVNDVDPPQRLGQKQRQRNWCIRVEYYHAAKKVVNDPNIPFNYKEVSVRAGRAGNGVLYALFGKDGRRKLISDYISQHTPRHDGLTALYDRGASVIEFLFDEVKVWSYWPHRRGWLTELERASDVTRQAAAESLVSVLADWAAAEPALASCLGFSPPIAAVEDLLVIWGKDVPAADAHGLLRDVIELAQGPLGKSANGVLGVVRPRLEEHLPSRAEAPPDHVAILAETSLTAIQWIAALPHAERRAARRAAIEVLSDALADLSESGGGA